MLHAVLIFIFLILPIPAHASTYYVPDHFPTIQSALSDDSVANGDMVIVRAGTYVECIDFVGKRVKLRSESGPAVTTIDADGADTAVTMWNCAGTDAAIEGFTITGGIGIGIHLDQSAVTIAGNTLTGNGTGVSIEQDDDSVILGNTISNNGVGILGWGRTLLVSDNEITQNNSTGIWCYGVSPVEISDNTISDNGGKGIYLESDYYGYCTPSLIRNNVIRNNDGGAYGYGGGIHLGGSASRIIGNAFLWNTAQRGAALYAWGGKFGGSVPTITGNVFAFNTASSHGGGICTNEAICPDITNNTFYGNSAMYGGAICDGFFSPLYVTNCIFRNNTATLEGDAIWVDWELDISHSDLQDGQSAIHLQSYATLNWGDGMFDDDPQLADPVVGDFHLSRFSPCINRGTNDGAYTEDRDGDPVPQMGAADVGADEFSGDHLLESDNFELSAAAGGTVNLSLRARADDAGRTYLVLGSLSGTVPGTPLPGGMMLRLNMDAFTTTILLPLVNTPLFQDFMGTLDGSGNAAAQLNAPPLPTSAVGAVLCFAYAINNPFDLVSNPVQLTITP